MVTVRKKMFDELQLTLFGAPEPQPAQVEEKPVRMTVKQLKDELDREQMRLAVVGVAAHGGSVEGIRPEYDSDSLRAVLRIQEDRERLRQIPPDWQVLHRRCQLAEAEVARLHSALTTQYDAIVATVQQVDTTVPLDVHEMRDEILAAITQHDPRKGAE